MRRYTIFTNNKGEIFATGDKSNKFAFIFSGLWLLWKGLWEMALLFIILECCYAALYYYNVISSGGFWALYMAQAAFISLQSSYFTECYLYDAGYKVRRVVMASSADSALYTYKELSKNDNRNGKVDWKKRQYTKNFADNSSKH